MLYILTILGIVVNCCVPAVNTLVATVPLPYADAKMERLMETNAPIMVQLAAMSIVPPAVQLVGNPAYMAPVFSAPPATYYAPPPANYYAPPVTQVVVPNQYGYNTSR